MTYKTKFLFFFLSVFIFAGLFFNFTKPPAMTVSQKRLGHLKRGINVESWFIYDEKSRWLSEKDFQALVETEAKKIRSLGFDHVRLSIDPNLLEREPKIFTKLYFAISQLILHDLAVIIDIHQNLGLNSFPEKEFHDFWQSFARFLVQFDPDKIFPQILNEPTIKDREVWAKIQSELVVTVRTEMPQHTIIAMGANYSSLDELLAMKPLADKNVIYDFHFYAPGIFTHQRTTWAVPYYRRLNGIPYPFGPENGAHILAQIPKDDKESLRMFRERYEGQRWDGTRIEKLLKQAYEWSVRWKAPVICAEFGAYRSGAKNEHRAAWIKDVRTALEKYNIGWSLWSYEGQFGLIIKSEEGFIPDPLILGALGLKL